MATFGQLVLTKSGIQAQLNAQNGTPLKFSKIGIGSGEYTGDYAELTSLVKEEVLVDVSKTYVSNDVFVVSGAFSNEGLESSFDWREIGLYFEDENGNNVLYCYSNAGDNCDNIPATTDERYVKTVRIATAISSSSNITIVTDSGAVATVEQILELQDQIDDIVDGTTTVGNAHQLDGHDSTYFATQAEVTEIGNNTAENLIPYPYTDTSQDDNGITFTDNGDGSISVKGTATANAYFSFANASSTLFNDLKDGKTYILSGFPFVSTKYSAYIRFFKDSVQTSVQYIGANGSTFTIDKTTCDSMEIVFYVASGVSIDAVLFPMLEPGTVAHSYIPYKESRKSLRADLNAVTEQAEKLTTNVENLTENVNNIEIGGRNLIRNTGTTMHLVANNSNSFTHIPFTKTLESGKTYTLSAKIDIVAGSPVAIGIALYNSDMKHLESIQNVIIVDGRIEVQLPISKYDDISKMLMYIGAVSATTGNTIDVSELMLEESTIKSNWTPAPEDLSRIGDVLFDGMASTGTLTKSASKP